MPTASASAREVAATHAQGETVLTGTPRRVAVFDLAALDILTTLGVEAVVGVPKGGGKATLPPPLWRYADTRYADVGTLFEPDAAALTALKPDLIVVGGRSARSFDKAKAIAPTIDLSVRGQGLARAAIENTRKLGSLFGVADRAESRVAAFEAQLSRLHAKAAHAGTGLVLFVTGRGAMVHAPGDRFGTAYDFIGIRAAVAPVAKRGTEPRPAPGTAEAAAAAQRGQAALAAALASEPDWLIVLDRAAATGKPPSPIAERLGAHPQIAASRSWKEGRVIYLDPKGWYLVGAGIDVLSRSAAATLKALEGVQP
ncbi:ABC transporter substrate-binding protein [Sphingomonas sp. RHCKR7]|uniref:ABC transporter substrate-binding protein n=1 Tax=Sphingomonas folli TaxID=2862497 RepID=UPI001CA48880|nr:ABC transporter substrate-binding protein [Sphingomonas folli]MBW6527734.1 ABC transporter substrate-binding protein [Sphingomonas folli]